jgi:hypothetical protein
MPTKFHWTEAQDLQIRRLRAEGATWDSISAVLGLTRWTVIERGRRIGARRPPLEAPEQREDPARDSLPPGHPRSWGVLTVGTVLEGMPYPLPLFPR